jgi:hypothetical protein
MESWRFPIPVHHASRGAFFDPADESGAPNVILDRRRARLSGAVVHGLHAMLYDVAREALPAAQCIPILITW